MTATPAPRTGALLAVILALAAAAAVGAPPPVPATEILAPRLVEPRAPDVAVNDAGRAVAVWTARAGTGFAVVARVRETRAGAWLPAARASAIVASRPMRPTVSVAGDGSAVVLWRVRGGAVESAALRSGASAGWARRTVAPDGQGFASPDVAAAGAGGAFAVWADSADGVWRARRAALVDGAWSLDPPLDLSAAGLVPPGAPPEIPPDLTVAPRGGAAAVAWPGRQAVPGYLGEPGEGPLVDLPPTRVAVALRPPGAHAWQPPAVLSEAGVDATVAVGEGGHVGVAWLEREASLMAAVREPGAAAWPAAVALATATDGVTAPAFPALAINGEGYALAAWASGARSGGGLAVRARTRSGPSGVWGAERTVFDGFSFFSMLDLATLQAAIDDFRVGHLAWLDPEGPGSATVHAASGGSGGWTSAARIRIGEDLNEPALAVSARGGAVLVTPGAEAVGPPNVHIAAAGFPAPPAFTLSRAQLVINQRISQAAVRRVNAAMARLDAGLRPEHIRDGTLEAADFGEAVRVEGAPTGASVPPTPVPALEVATPGPRDPGGVRVSVAQLLINQRISQAALRRATFGRRLFALGLTGDRVADGAITAAKLAPGLRIAEAAPSAATPAEGPRLASATPAGGRVTLTAAQLRINQRISQAAVLRANWLVEKLEGGVRGGDVRDGALRHEHLAPELRTG